MRSLHLPFNISTTLVLFILLFSSQSIFAQSGWFNLTPIPTSESYNGVQMFANGTGYAYCDGGAVVKTTDKGSSWFFLPDEYNFKRVLSISGASKVSFLNSVIGFLVNNQRIFKTTDGGNNWMLQGSSSLTNSKHFQFTDELTGYSASNSGSMAKTTTGGISWFNINTPSTLEYKGSFKFINNNTGIFAASNYHIYQTTNGGINWQVTDSTNTIELWQINIVNPGLIFIGANSGKLFKSTDGGIHWSSFNTGFSYNTILFNSELTGYIAISGGGFKKTTNGGTNWFDLPSSFLRALQGCTMDSSGFGVAVGWCGQIASTSNGGQTWNNSTNFMTSSPTGIQFLNSSTGYITTDRMEILKTTNGGFSFQKFTFNRNLTSIFIYSAEEIMAGGDSNLVKTTNGGLNWTQHHVNANLEWFIFPNALTGFGIHTYYVYPVSSASVDVKTTDGGLTWRLTGTNASRRIHFFDSNNGIYSDIRQIGTNGPYYTVLFKTTNTGVTWNKFDSLYSIKLDGFSFVNDQIGYSSGNAKVYKTTNHGTNWQFISNFDARGCQFKTEQVGFGYNCKTTNGGVNWFTLDDFLTDKYFVDENTGYGFPAAWPILKKTTNGGVNIVEVKNISSEIPAHYSLSQNYPNPFNPTTKINFDLKNTAFAMLRVYDITGREVRTLVNEKLSAGSYSFDFNASELPSGVYFYQLQTDDFIETKKMILLK